MGDEELKISMVGHWKIQVGKGKGTKKIQGKRERVREVGNGEGVGSGIITLRGNEKCEDKNSKYQSWEGLEMER